MGDLHTRSKRRFGSARAAWLDIAEKTGLSPMQVTAVHTSRFWVWRRR